MAEQISLNRAENPYRPMIQRARKENLTISTQIRLKIKQHRYRILLLSQLQQDLKSQTRRTRKIYEIWWALKSPCVQLREADGVNDREFGVIRQRIALKADFNVIWVCVCGADVRRIRAGADLRRDDSDVHALAAQVGDEIESCSANAVDWAKGLCCEEQFFAFEDGGEFEGAGGVFSWRDFHVMGRA